MSVIKKETFFPLGSSDNGSSHVADFAKRNQTNPTKGLVTASAIVLCQYSFFVIFLGERRKNSGKLDGVGRYSH